MRINLINYEAAIGIKDGILTKFANKMNESLLKLGHESKVTTVPDPDAEVNHHIHFRHYRTGGGGVNTLMVTHFLENELDKLEILSKALETADMGIAMSEHTQARLIANGIPAEKLTYVLPPHDGRKRRPRVVAMLTKVYGDNRKREWMVTELVKTIDPEKFIFKVMGSGWREIVDDLVAKGFSVEYTEGFDKDLHDAILDSSDYLLSTGEDEGAIGVLEAANAGVKTITTPQGYHYEIGIDYPFNTQEELNSIFKKLAYNPVETWTWDRYVKDHLEIWKNLSKE